MDVPLVIRQRLTELGLEQKDLAAAAEVTESYISQLLARKKAAPAPGRTDLYEKIGKFLKLPAGELSRLAEVQRQEELKKRSTELPEPLFRECRELIVEKCDAERRNEIRRIFEKEPFGELERLITQTLLAVSKKIANAELGNEDWLREMAQLSKRSYEKVQVTIRQMLDSDVLHVSIENFVALLEPLTDSWDINLKTFSMKIVLNAKLAAGGPRHIEFMEREVAAPLVAEPGLEDFLGDRVLSEGVTEQEIEFFRSLRFGRRRPTAVYYYRELQNLRDPLHFRNG
jgi:transcriptional regulator with XRE-family HTH domain